MSKVAYDGTDEPESASKLCVISVFPLTEHLKSTGIEIVLFFS